MKINDTSTNYPERVLRSRSYLGGNRHVRAKKTAEEGGCGVVGFACSVPVRGKHIFEPSIQMHNRGNGKGGGIAAAGLVPEQLGVDAETLRNAYILQVALLDPSAKQEVEDISINPYLDIEHKTDVETVCDHRDVGLDVKPPDIVRYFVRAKNDALDEFAGRHGMTNDPERAVEDEFIYQNSFRLNQQFYASLGEQRAFVLSHARNLMIFKIVGYAEQVVQYYKLDDFRAQVWIAHQRYPTKGRVWHPAGSHPFIGMNEALVHNGDFANYASVSEYLNQRNITTQFLTDTEVSVLLFDLLTRVYGYPTEYAIEAMAPTTELDFDRLPKEKQRVYKAVHSVHVHGSPDGPWFFIIARSDADNEKFQLLGITDTAMLRPQVFALQEGDVSIGLVGSEKQAIDATLHSLAQEDDRFRLVADRYWNARGGSHSDGGAFSFTVHNDNGTAALTCEDKFGRPIKAPAGEYAINAIKKPQPPDDAADIVEKLDHTDVTTVFGTVSAAMKEWNLGNVQWLTEEVEKVAGIGDTQFGNAVKLLTLLVDRRYDPGNMRPSAVVQIISERIHKLLDSVPDIGSDDTGRFKRIHRDIESQLEGPGMPDDVLVVFARDFEPEGDGCDSRLIVKAHEQGWRQFIVYGLKGQRFTGCGFGSSTDDVRIDVYGSSGDYLASGIDGMAIYVHGNGQDQLGQIMSRGQLVVFGDVGQTFMYGAKGGEVYVMGNAAGRPLINAPGRPRVVINGTCLDYLAESFMAGDPHDGGGFVILNAVEFDDTGRVRPQDMPYPGSNLFSLASGGAIFVRDPHKRIVDDQLNGGKFVTMTDDDWQLILPYLETNEKHFGISVENDLLTVDGTKRAPIDVYRKISAMSLAILAAESVPE